MNPINAKTHKTGITYWGESVTGTNKREGKKKNKSIEFSTEADGWSGQQKTVRKKNKLKQI